MAAAYWGDFSDYLAVVLWIMWALVFISLAFDELNHRLTHWLEAQRKQENRLAKKRNSLTGGLDDFDPLNRFEVLSRIFGRFKSEMMVLGFLAFAVWCCNVSGVFHQITLGVHDFDGNAAAAESDSSSASTAARPQTYHDYFFRPQSEDQCERKFMREGSDLLHLVERCHMILFITMCSYFLLITVSLVRVHAFYSELHQAELDEHMILKRAARTKRATLFLRVAQRARAILLDHVSESATLKQIVMADPAMRATALVDKRLAVSAFVHETSNYAVLDLINFPSSTWVLILFRLTIFCITVNFCCLGGGTLYVVVLGYGVTTFAYTAARHALWLRRFLTYDTATNRTTCWPCSTLDRIVSPLVGPGTTGFVPWRRCPREKTARECLQAHLFGYLLLIVLLIADDQSSFTHTAQDFESEHAAHPAWSWWLWCFAPHVLIVCAWAGWLIPSTVIVQVFPPYISADEGLLLLDVLRAYPQGHTRELHELSKRRMSVAIERKDSSKGSRSSRSSRAVAGDKELRSSVTGCENGETGCQVS